MALFALTSVGCRSHPDKVLTVTVSPRQPLPGVVRLEVKASQNSRAVSTSLAADSSSQTLSWPVDIVLHTAGLGSGDTVIEAKAFDAERTEIARGVASATLPAASTVSIELICESLTCASTADAGGLDAVGASVDGGADAPTPTEGGSKCGNGRLDGDETCDTAIPSELPGACPQNCDDGISCTLDKLTGSACGVACVHTEITASVATDGCCPSGLTHGADPDCSNSCGDGVVEPGESCDLAIIADLPGACPTVESCDDANPCTVDRLISANTCSAACAHTVITAAAPSDGCCPVGADARVDSDCPAACGNGVLEPGERCDIAIAEGGSVASPGVCPSAASCSDGDPCTADVVTGSGCQAFCQNLPITSPVPGDGCCPLPGLGTSVDPDCKPVCGNGVLEPGEACDSAIPPGQPGFCLTACPDSPGACLTYRFVGSADACSVTCQVVSVGACSPTTDGCCPAGCAPETDPDCPATCGNAVLDPGETCDTAIADGPGSCPRNCSDGVACTEDILIDGGSCTARCAFVPTARFRNGDGCCPPGAYAGLDSDCPAICGNGVVEAPWETCDTGTEPASCASVCPPADSCAPFVTSASTSACNFPCLRQPIMGCISGDGCCPSGVGCTAANDSDCGPACGNGFVDETETCDRGITAGHEGACPASCVDADPCTLDFASGNRESCDRVCTHVLITTCGSGDRCCPPGCTAATDGDCASSCGDGIVQARETCDPPSSCPGSCADDGDPCTLDQLVGSPSTCDSACRHTPILRCSGAVRDGCCPTGCSSSLDGDC